MLRTKPILLATMLLLASCTTNGPANDNAQYCSTHSPIYLDPTDRVSAATAREIDAYDDKGQALCDWSVAK